MQSTSSASPVEPAIIRAGSDGRLRYTPDQRGELLAAFDRSGLSAMAFSSQHDIAYQSFIAWLRKRRLLAVGCLPVRFGRLAARRMVSRSISVTSRSVELMPEMGTAKGTKSEVFRRAV